MTDKKIILDELYLITDDNEDGFYIVDSDHIDFKSLEEDDNLTLHKLSVEPIDSVPPNESIH